MKDNVNWTRRTLLTTIVSSIVGFWLLDGAALVASLVGKEFEVNIGAKVASTIVCASCALVVEQAHMVHSAMNGQREQMRGILESDIHQQLSTAMAQILATTAFAPAGGSMQSPAVRALVSNIGGLVQPVTALPEPLRSGVATWIQGSLDQYRKSVNDLLANGVAASLAEHVSVTRSIVNAGTGAYIQINQRAFDVSTEWSRDWREFLSTMKPNSGRISEYIVLQSQEYLKANAVKLRSMRDALSRSGVVLLTCDRDLVTDSIGTFELDRNLELFDDAVIKTQSIGEGGYRGGIKLTMSVALAVERPELVKIARAIRECAVPHK